MTLSDLLTAPLPPLTELRGLWLVLDAATAADLAAKQAAHGSAVHRIAPVAGPDDRFALCADLLSEVGPGGIHHALFANLDVGKFASVEVMPMDSLKSLGWFSDDSEE